MSVDAFALKGGATQPVRSKLEAEKAWEPKCIDEIVAGSGPSIVGAVAADGHWNAWRAGRPPFTPRARAPDLRGPRRLTSADER